MSWSDRYLALRDRWLSSPRFQRWAAAFPLTRPTARNRARALFDVCAGFVYSQILFACVRLKLFDLLAEGPETAADIAATLQLPLDSTARLLDAALALRECTRLPMLQLTCRDTPEGLVFCRATVRPDFSDETVSDAVRAYFAESRS